MSLAPSRLPFALLAAFLGWQAACGVIDLAGEAASDPAADRWRALTAPERARIDPFIPELRGLLDAIEERSPPDARVAFLFALDERTFQMTHRLGVLLQPRRTVAIVQPLPAAEIDAAARLAAASGHAVYIADMESEFPLPSGVERVAGGPNFTLWRLVR